MPSIASPVSEDSNNPPQPIPRLSSETVGRRVAVLAAPSLADLSDLVSPFSGEPAACCGSGLVHLKY